MSEIETSEKRRASHFWGERENGQSPCYVRRVTTFQRNLIQDKSVCSHWILTPESFDWRARGPKTEYKCARTSAKNNSWNTHSVHTLVWRGGRWREKRREKKERRWRRGSWEAKNTGQSVLIKISARTQPYVKVNGKMKKECGKDNHIEQRERKRESQWKNQCTSVWVVMNAYWFIKHLAKVH